MGVCHKLVCKGCRKEVDLIKDHLTAAAFQGTVPTPWKDAEPYRSLHAIAFMRRHWGHDVAETSDHDEDDVYFTVRDEEDVSRPPSQP